jgi:hypothetical protein
VSWRTRQQVAPTWVLFGLFVGCIFGAVVIVEGVLWLIS